jgi:hypothetical protein
MTHALRFDQRLGEGLPRAVVGGWLHRPQRLGLRAQGLVQPAHQGQARLCAKPPGQARPRQAVEIADAMQAETVQQSGGLLVQTQGLDG